MSYAPKTLLDLRDYVQPFTGLSDNDLGIVGDPEHIGGYHCGWDRRRIINGVLRDYSWTESSRDSGHRTNAASAFDIGMFPRLRELSVWLAGQCAARAPDCRDIREIIYSPDGKTVVRWDGVGIRVSGDPSHLLHTHISWFRDSESRDKTAVFRRFFEGDDTMPISDVDALILIGRVEALTLGLDKTRISAQAGEEVKTVTLAKQTAAKVTVLESKLDQVLALLKSGVPVPAKVDLSDAAVAEIRDAVADLGETGSAGVRADLP